MWCVTPASLNTTFSLSTLSTIPQLLYPVLQTVFSDDLADTTGSISEALIGRYHDEGSINVMWGYWRAHNLEPGANLIAHHFKLIGLPDWIPERQEVVGLYLILLTQQQPIYIFKKTQALN